MQRTKAIIRLIYVPLRFIFWPAIWLFRPTGMRTETIVAICIVGVVIFFLSPMASARFGFKLALPVIAAGLILAYLIMVWGKEFEC